jgi:hypothetical protein
MPKVDSRYAARVEKAFGFHKKHPTLSVPKLMKHNGRTLLPVERGLLCLLNGWMMTKRGCNRQCQTVSTLAIHTTDERPH